MMKHYFWLFPFLFFLSGYFVTRYFLHIPYLKVPSVIGQQLTDACTTLSSLNLNVRILELKEDEELPEGTVLYQMPNPHQLIKPRQTIFLTISKHAPHNATPYLYGKITHELKQLCNDGYKIKLYDVASTEQSGICIGQTPAPGTPLNVKIITAYISHKPKSLVVWPNFIGRTIQEAVDFLEPYQLEAHVEKQTHRSIIQKQHPLAGSIVDLNQKPYIQFHS